ncbi:MAG: hypothetical protein RJA76_1380 [Bacteroidota bacterium]|jgi:molybdopterin converting factor small subunit
MTVYTVLLFGITKDLLKEKSIQIEVEDSLRVSDFLEIIKIKFPALQNLPSLRVAADHHFPDDSFLLLPSMEIALIPPVSGG